MKRTIIVMAFTIFLYTAKIFAQDLVYTPINPSFMGGSSFNASWLMAEATAQKQFTQTTSTSGYYGTNALNDFKQTIQRQVLSQLTQKLFQNTFGENGLKEGHYEMGDYLIDITSVSSGINIHIYDSVTGNETDVIVPYY